MKKILFCIWLLILTGCAAEERSVEQAPIGVIGTETAISRGMAAKMIALAFYTDAELEGMEAETNYSDISKEDWAYPYICGCTERGFFAGGEEGTFRPEDDMTLQEAQILMDRLAPEHDSRIVLTEENKNRPVSYELWIRLLETALRSGRDGKSLESYGIREKNAVVLSSDGLLDTGKVSAKGIDLRPYRYSRIRFLEKEGEILALLSVEAQSPLLQNIYCRNADGKLILETGGGAAAFSYGGKTEEGIYDVRLEKGGVAEMTPTASLGRCTVKRVNEEEILLAEKGTLKWAENARIYNGREKVCKGGYADLICGTDTAEYYEKNGEICGAVIRENAVPKQIRVFLKGAEQKKAGISAETGFLLSNGKAEKQFAAEETAVLTAELPWFDHGLLSVTSKSPIRIDFADGTSCQYEGKLELERRSEGGFSIVNEVPMERYLLGVVPNEMPRSFGQTALEAQAIAARSFAYNQFYGNAYCGYGAHVVDTTASQVYLGYRADETAEAAVKATEGMCAVTADGTVARTYFYSSSCGFGAGSEEVWSADGTFSGKGKSYLQPQKYGEFGKPETEKEWLAFWQDWGLAGMDDRSPWYRWKVYFGCGQLTEILQNTLPSSVNCRIEGNLSDMGKLKKIAVTRRGEGGVAMELELIFEKGKALVRTENAIRKALSPTKIRLGEEIYLQRKGGESLTGHRMLPSGFFAVKEMRNEAGDLTGIALYGGGNGHGVGMSQYGTAKLAKEGKTAEEIISYFFPGTTTERVM